MGDVKLYTRRDLAKMASLGIVGTALAGRTSGVSRGLLAARGASMVKRGGTVDWEGKTAFEVTIPDGGATFDFYSVSPTGTTIEWGDGTSDSTATSSRSHTYTSGGTYIIKIAASATEFKASRTGFNTDTYVTRVFNFGRNLTTLERAFGWNYGCVNLRTVETVDIPNVTSMSQCFKLANSLEYVKFPENFGENATDIENIFVSYVSRNLVLDLPPSFGKNATNMTNFIRNASGIVKFPDFLGSAAATLNSAFTLVNMEEIVFPAGFGCVATNIRDMIGYSTVIRRVSLPSGFGAEAEEGKCDFIKYNSRSTRLTKLEMHGHQNGIRYSLDLRVTYMDIESVCSVMESLQAAQTTQTLTLNTYMRSTYEASADYIAARDELTARGWQVAFA